LLDHHDRAASRQSAGSRADGEFVQALLHRLAAMALIDIPRVNTLRVYFGNGQATAY